MVEAQTQAQAQPAAAPPPIAAEVGVGALLDSFLADGGAEDAGEQQQQQPPADAAGEPAATEDTAEAEPEAQRAEPEGDEVIFSDEAMATPEGVTKARERVRELRRISHEKYVGLKKYEARVAKRHDKLVASVSKFTTEKRAHDLLINNVRSSLQGLHSDDPDAMLTALGHLTGKDGLRAFEQLASRLVHKGRPPLDPQVQDVIDRQEKQIAELRQSFERRQEQERASHVEGQIRGHRQNIVGMIEGDESLPHLKRLLADDPEHVVDFVVTSITRSNGSVPARQLFQQIEQDLASHFGASPKGEGGAGAARTTPNRGTAQRPPGQSIGPRAAAASTSREPSEEESLRALANDPQFMSSLGL